MAAKSEQDKFAISDEDVKKGAWRRPTTGFHGWVKADANAEFPAEAGRYVLVVSYACPWASRTLMVRDLKGLRHAIDISVVNPLLQGLASKSSVKTHDALFSSEYNGWSFDEEYPFKPDPSVRHMHDLYTGTDPSYPHKNLSVPVLYDTKTKKIVNNESSEIIKMLNDEFNAFAKRPTLTLYPPGLDEAQDKINELVYPNINDGVYRCGFGTLAGQEIYEKAYDNLFAALDTVEELLGKQRYLCGDRFTMADVRLFVTLIRFDPVYVSHFRTNRNTLREMPNLWNYTKEIYQMPGIRRTVNMRHIKLHYYASHTNLNPSGVVPKGPLINFDEPHDRAAKFPDGKPARSASSRSSSRSSRRSSSSKKRA